MAAHFPLSTNCFLPGPLPAASKAEREKNGTRQNTQGADPVPYALRDSTRQLQLNLLTTRRHLHFKKALRKRHTNRQSLEPRSKLCLPLGIIELI